MHVTQDRQALALQVVSQVLRWRGRTTPPQSELRFRNRARFGIPLLILSGLVTSCEGHFGQRSITRTEGKIVLPAGTKLVRFNIPEGEISVMAGAEGEVSFRGDVMRTADLPEQLAHLQSLASAPVMVPSDEPGVVEIRAPDLPSGLDPRQNKVILNLIAYVPKGLPLEAVTTNGQIGARGRMAATSLTTEHGDVMLFDSTCDAKLRGGGGKIIVDGHSGGLDAEGSEFMIQVFVRELGASGLRLVNRVGAIQAHVAGDAQFELEMMARQGMSLNSFGLPGERIETMVAGRKMHGTRMSGKVGQGGPKIYIESRAAGNVSLNAKDFDKN